MFCTSCRKITPFQVIHTVENEDRVNGSAKRVVNRDHNDRIAGIERLTHDDLARALFLAVTRMALSLKMRPYPAARSASTCRMTVCLSVL
jgi:hypothetical protein